MSVCVATYFVYAGADREYKLAPRETEYSAQFWANNKIFISYRLKFIQATHIFSGPRRGSPTCHPSQSTHGTRAVKVYENLRLLLRQKFKHNS